MNLPRRNGINWQNWQNDGTRSASYIIQKTGSHVKRKKQGYPKII